MNVYKVEQVDIKIIKHFWKNLIFFVISYEYNYTFVPKKNIKKKHFTHLNLGKSEL